MRVELHAALSLTLSVLFRIVPAVMGYFALEIFSADIAIFTILLAYRLKRPNFGGVAVEALDAVLMAITSIVLLDADAHLLAVTTLALAGLFARASRIETLFQVGCFFALSDFHSLFHLGCIGICKVYKEDNVIDFEKKVSG